MTKPVDVIMWAGEDHYTVSSFIQEAKIMGVSKRIPKTAIPEGIVPGRSKIFIKHRRAIVNGNLDDLLRTLDESLYLQHCELPDNMLHLVIFLERLRESEPAIWKELVEGYKLFWTPGVIGYAYITGIQYVAYDHEEGLPDEMAHMDYLVEPVRIEYEEDWYCPFCSTLLGNPLNFTGRCDSCGHEFSEALDENN